MVSVRGVELRLHGMGDYLSDEVRRTGDFYEAAVLDEVAHRLAGMGPGTLVDAGAHVGNHTAYLAAFVPYTTIHAFEPLPAHLPLLLDNVFAYQRVLVHPVALSDHVGAVPWRPEPTNLGHSRVAEGAEHEVAAVTLDSVGLQRVRLIKLDVEGHEPQVLAGAKTTLERWQPLVVIEDWEQAYAELLPGYQLLAEWGTQHQTYLYGPA
jgi:FkbM family methyltransferase